MTEKAATEKYVDKTDKTDKVIKERHSSQTSQKSLVHEENSIGSSPDGRFVKFDKIIGGGSFKTVFQGYDTESLLSVAWCELNDRNISAEDRKRFFEESAMLKKLDHPNIVKYHDYFEMKLHNEFRYVLITELLVSGTLKQYLKRLRNVKEKVLKNWCKQILAGLLYLHSRQPPIIHRDLKCDNIFINGADSSLKLGDLGLAANKKAEFVSSVIGTPEFMAPEMYEECYDEAVDVYAFGMCLIEMITGEYPYMECSNAAQIYRKVTKGSYPNVVDKIHHEDLKRIILSCIASDKSQRLKVKELLANDYFKIDDKDILIELKSDPDVSFNFQLINDKNDPSTIIRMIIIYNENTPDREESTIEFRYYTSSDTYKSAIDQMADFKIIPREFAQQIYEEFHKFMSAQGFDAYHAEPQNVAEKANVGRSRRLIKVSTVYGDTVKAVDDQSDFKVSTVSIDKIEDDHFLLLYVRSYDNGLIECGVKDGVKKFTFKFSILNDVAEDIAKKLVNASFLDRKYIGNFIKSLKKLMAILDDNTHSEKISEVINTGCCFKFFAEDDREIIMFPTKHTKNTESYISLTQQSGQTQKIDLSLYKVEDSVDSSESTEKIEEPIVENQVSDSSLTINSNDRDKIISDGELEFSQTNLIDKVVNKDLNYVFPLNEPCQLVPLKQLSDLVEFVKSVNLFEINNNFNISEVICDLISIQNRFKCQDLKSDQNNEFEGLCKSHVEQFLDLRAKQLMELDKFKNDVPVFKETFSESAPVRSLEKEFEITHEEIMLKSMEELRKMSTKAPPIIESTEHKPSLNELMQKSHKVLSSSTNSLSTPTCVNGVFPNFSSSNPTTNSNPVLKTEKKEDKPDPTISQQIIQ